MCFLDFSAVWPVACSDTCKHEITVRREYSNQRSHIPAHETIVYNFKTNSSRYTNHTMLNHSNTFEQFENPNFAWIHRSPNWVFDFRSGARVYQNCFNTYLCDTIENHWIIFKCLMHVDGVCWTGPSKYLFYVIWNMLMQLAVLRPNNSNLSWNQMFEKLQGATVGIKKETCDVNNVNSIKLNQNPRISFQLNITLFQGRKLCNNRKDYYQMLWDVTFLNPIHSHEHEHQFR